MKIVVFVACALSFFGLVRVSHGADEKIKDMARAVLAKYQDAVVTIVASGTYEIETDGKKTKEKFNVEATGTVVTEDGLTISNPSEMLQLPAPRQDTWQGVEFQKFKIIVAGGREIEAELVSRDSEIGAMFLAPKRRDSKFKHVVLEKTAMPALLDDMIVIERLSSHHDREIFVRILQIGSILSKKKAFVGDFTNMNCPVFSANGTCLGLCASPPLSKNTESASASVATVALTYEAIQPRIKKAHKKWKDAEKNLKN